MLQLTVRNPNAIEAINVSGPPMPVNPDARRPNQVAPLRSRDRLERRPERLAAPSLHFHERDQSAATYHEIDLDPAGSEPVRLDVPAATGQVTHGPFFRRHAVAVPPVRPIGRVTVYAAFHADNFSLA